MKVYECTNQWSLNSTWSLDFSNAMHVHVSYRGDLFDLAFSHNGRSLGCVPIHDAFLMWVMEEDIPVGLKRLLRELRRRPNKEDWLNYRV